MSELQTISAHIGYLRTLIKQFSDDSMFDDEVLYKTFIDARATLLSRLLETNKNRSPFNYQTLYVPLELADFEECLPDGTLCKVRKSTYKIPRFFSTKHKDVFKVTTFSGKELTYGSLLESTLLQYTKTMAGSAVYEIRDEYLYIHNDPMLKAVLIKGIAENPLDIAEFPRCDANGVFSDQTCFNPENEVIPMDADLNSTCYQLCMQLLGIPFTMPEDRSNNDKSETSSVI